MFGLVAWIVLLLYLAFLVWATRRGWRWGIECKGWIGRKRWLGAAIGFLVVYLPLFWDWIPTVVVHQYYCATESGFWVYKTLDQWKKENPGVIETLVPRISISGGAQNIDERFSIVTRSRNPVPLLTTRIIERELLDAKTRDVLARSVSVGSGVGNMLNGGGYKFWLNQERCDAKGFWEFTKQLENQRRGR